MRLRFIACALATLTLAGVGLAAAFGGTASDHQMQHPDYRGHFAGRPDSVVAVKVIRRGGRPTFAKVEADGYKQICEDNQTYVRNGYPFRVPFVNRRTFYDDTFTEGPAGIFVIKGTLRKSGRVVKGYLSAVNTSVEGELACTTFGREDFRATAVDR